MSPRGARAGVTMIELLVVLGIIILLATISISAFSRTGSANRLAAVEQLLSGQIRQARYTARTTGQAVLLYLDADQRTIAGVSRIPIWQGSAEAGSVPADTDEPPFAGSGGLDRVKFLSRNGRTGSGICRNQSATTSDIASIELASNSGAQRRLHLTRTPAGKPSEGFMLSCAVSVPTSAPTLKPQPLVVISGDPAGSPPNANTSYAGLILLIREENMYGAAETPPTDLLPTGFTPISNPNPKRICWEIQGWILGEGFPTPTVISSIDDGIAGGPTPEARFENDGTSGSNWLEIGLMYTGTAMELYRNGMLVARTTAGIPARIAGYQKDHRLFFGSLNSTSGIQRTIDPRTIIDDIALFRIGTDLPATIPSGIIPSRSARISIRPDGRMIDEFQTDGGTDINLEFSGVYQDSDDKANLTIAQGTGLITSSKINLARTAP